MRKYTHRSTLPGATNLRNSYLQSLALSHTFVYFAIAIPAAKGERTSKFTHLRVLQLTSPARPTVYSNSVLAVYVASP